MIISALAKQCQGIIDLRGDKVPAGDGLLVGAAYAPGDVIEILHHLAVVGADELVGVMPLVSPSHVELQESPLDTPPPEGGGFSGYGARHLRALPEPKF